VGSTLERFERALPDVNSPYGIAVCHISESSVPKRPWLKWKLADRSPRLLLNRYPHPTTSRFAPGEFRPETTRSTRQQGVASPISVYRRGDGKVNFRCRGQVQRRREPRDACRQTRDAARRIISPAPLILVGICHLYRMGLDLRRIGKKTTSIKPPAPGASRGVDTKTPRLAPGARGDSIRKWFATVVANHGQSLDNRGRPWPVCRGFSRYGFSSSHDYYDRRPRRGG
jgi:hypothetical protein